MAESFDVFISYARAQSLQGLLEGAGEALIDGPVLLLALAGMTVRLDLPALGVDHPLDADLLPGLLLDHDRLLRVKLAVVFAADHEMLIVPNVLVWGLRNTLQVRPCKLDGGLPPADGRFDPMQGLSQ